VYDVATFDMIVMLRLKFIPGCCAFVSHSRAAQQVLAISNLNTPAIHMFDVSAGSEEPLKSLDAVHQAPVTCIQLCGPSNVVRSLTQDDDRPKAVSGYLLSSACALHRSTRSVACTVSHAACKGSKSLAGIL
jgi:hypothetical protein